MEQPENIPFLSREVEDTILALEKFLEEECLPMDSGRHIPATFKALEGMIDKYSFLKDRSDKLKSLQQTYL